MASTDAGLSCPGCGTTMNRHAAKPVHPVDPREPLDPDLGAVIQEVHCCPDCGAMASRRTAGPAPRPPGDG